MSNVECISKYLRNMQPDQDKYTLAWQDYTNHVKEMLHELMISDYLSDVTLVSVIKCNSRLIKSFSVPTAQFSKVSSMNSPKVVL